MPSNDYHRYVSKDQRDRKIKRIIWEILISAVLIISAIIFYIYWTEIIVKFLSSRVKLAPGSAGFKTWLNPPITTTRSYYLFNITNPKEIVTDPKSATIKFTDTSPYTYNVTTSKTNVKWLNRNTEISYAVERSFIRDSKRFNLSSVNDTGCFIDLVRAIFRTQYDLKNPAETFYTLGGGNDAFYHRNAVEQLEGFTSSLFNTVRDKMVGPNTDKSGFVYRQNGSRLYNVSIKTNLKEKGQVLKFSSELVRHNFTSASVYGFPIYDGLTYPPMLFNKPALHVFNSDFCKPVLIEFNRVVPIFEWMNLHEYKLKLIDYDNCTNRSDPSTCNEVDRLDVSKCISDSLPEQTIFLSKAHFYGSSNETIEKMNIEGFTPTSDKHDSFVHFEPYTGTPFKAILRIQINVAAIIDLMEEVEEDGTEKLQPIKGKKAIKRLIPVFWLDQEVTISDKIRDTMKNATFVLHYGHYVIIPLAILLTIIIIVIIEIVAKRSAKKARYSRGAYHKTGTTNQY